MPRATPCSTEVIGPLPEDARFSSWQREDLKLQVTVLSADTDPRHFVSAYAGRGPLANAVATPGQGGLMGLVFDLAAPAGNPDATDAASAGESP